MQIQAKPTAYNGYLFRSKLEAKWAVFFDALRISYVYEPEAFVCGDGSQYTPDFYLPNSYLRCKEGKGVYLEIKPLGWERDGAYIWRIQTAFNDKAFAVLLVGDPFDVVSETDTERNEQLSPDWDHCMTIFHFECCNALKFDYSDGSNRVCPICEVSHGASSSYVAAEAARSYPFKYTSATYGK